MEETYPIDENFVYNSEYIGVTKIGTFLVGVDMPPVIVINLSTRVDRREKTIETMREAKIPFMFFTAKPHTNPTRGCLESHISVVKWAQEKGYPHVCIFEDDFTIQFPLREIPDFPKDWSMVYLGGFCTHIKKWEPILNVQDSVTHYNNIWIKGTFYCDHAYFVRDTMYKKIIEEGWVYDREIDRFYTSEIHDKPEYDVYMTYLQYVIQYEGWSDIDKKIKFTNFTWPKPGERFGIP